jgi:metalloendopeptidase OMA1, mitochondrial
MKSFRRAAAALVSISLFSCTTAPYTGRSQLMLVSEPEEVKLGAEAFTEQLRDSVLSDNADAYRIVRKVGERIARAANKPDYQWEFRVFDDPEQVNAFCLPGGKVGVYTGIFPIARDEAGLAVIVGHEVAHALLRHAGERISRAQLVGAGVGLAGAAGGGTIGSLLGLGANVGLMLPFSRSQESEADKVGVILMAKAGYDPRVSVPLWQRMEQRSKEKSNAPPEFLSTHPSSATRIQELRDYMPQALEYYQAAGNTNETLPSLASLETARGKSERELLKRMTSVNELAGKQERAVAQAIGTQLRMDLYDVARERKALQIGYGQYAALRGIAVLGKSSIKTVVADYQGGKRWADLAADHGARMNDLVAWMGEVQRGAGK